MKMRLLTTILAAIALATTSTLATTPSTTEYRDQRGVTVNKKNAYYKVIITNYGDSIREEMYDMKTDRLRKLNTYSIYTPDRIVRHGIQQTYDIYGNETEETFVDSKAGTEDTWKWNANGKPYMHIVTDTRKNSKKVWTKHKDGRTTTTITDVCEGKKRERTMVKSDKKQELSYTEKQDGQETEVRYTGTDGHRYYRYPIQTGDTLWLNKAYQPTLPESATRKFIVVSVSANDIGLKSLDQEGKDSLLHRKIYVPTQGLCSQFEINGRQYELEERDGQTVARVIREGKQVGIKVPKQVSWNGKTYKTYNVTEIEAMASANDSSRIVLNSAFEKYFANSPATRNLRVAVEDSLFRWWMRRPNLINAEDLSHEEQATRARNLASRYVKEIMPGDISSAGHILVSSFVSKKEAQELFDYFESHPDSINPEDCGRLVAWQQMNDIFTLYDDTAFTKPIYIPAMHWTEYQAKRLTDMEYVNTLAECLDECGRTDFLKSYIKIQLAIIALQTTRISQSIDRKSKAEAALLGVTMFDQYSLVEQKSKELIQLIEKLDSISLPDILLSIEPIVRPVVSLEDLRKLKSEATNQGIKAKMESVQTAVKDVPYEVRAYWLDSRNIANDMVTECPKTYRQTFQRWNETEKSSVTGTFYGLLHQAMPLMPIQFAYYSKDWRMEMFPTISDMVLNHSFNTISEEDLTKLTQFNQAPNTVKVFKALDDVLASQDAKQKRENLWMVYKNSVICLNYMDRKKNTKPILVKCEHNPEFPGGEAALMAYIKQNLKYPAFAAENGIQGRVTLLFTIEKDGSISDIEVLRSPAAELSKEAIRVVQSMPKWKPGKQRGKAVRVKYVMPITFRL